MDDRSRGYESHLQRLLGRYVPDLILGANDGIITTLAIVSGVVGADLSTNVILILGFANLVADGISMGASNVLSRRSSADGAALPTLRSSSQHGAATFLGFVLAGLVPLLAYLLPDFGWDRYRLAVILAVVALFLIGSGRAYFTRRGWLVSGLEMFALGTLAAGAAYGIGALAARIIEGV
jgi:VIT1/CCC1 family predicted Fe2+/Mn2+ transporter